jgi:hypothetical protein
VYDAEVDGDRPDRAYRRLERPAHPKLFLLGLALLASWFPVAFGGLVYFWEKSASPVVALVSNHEEVALVLLLLCGLPGLPLLLLGYYGWHRATHPSSSVAART